jgi:hypothetical protein
MFEFVSWIIFSLAPIAALRWTNGCLCCCCCVLAGGALDEPPVFQLDSDPIAPGGGVCANNALLVWNGEGDNIKKKWEVLRDI